MKTLVISLLLIPLAAQGTIVTTAIDEADGGLGKGTGISLREAVKYSPTGTIITFDPALSGQTIRLGLGEITIDKSLTIDASALPSPVKLSADKTGNGKTSDDTLLLRLTGGSVTLSSLILSDANCGESSGCITISRNDPVYLLVDRCTLSVNSGYHAAVLYTRGTTSTDTITLQNSTISGNSVVKGTSAVSVSSSNFTIRNCTFANNATGAIYYGSSATAASKLTVENSTFVGNKASYGAGGIYMSDHGANASLKNTIFSGNTPKDISGGFSGSNILITDHPNLYPLGNYGGPTQTMPPNGLSSAIINRGGGTSLTADQRGLPRLGQHDIGAVEYQGDNSETALRWNFDLDGDGSPYGTEIALGTNDKVADSNNTRNLRGPTFNASSHPVLTFGIGSSVRGTHWILKRSTDLLTFTEIYRYNGTTYTAAPGITYTRSSTSITVTDRNPPPGGAFYRFEAVFQPQ